MLRVTASELGQASGIGVATIRRFELMSGVPTGSARSLAAIQTALEQMGIEFIGSPNDKPGVRLTRSSSKQDG